MSPKPEKMPEELLVTAVDATNKTITIEKAPRSEKLDARKFAVAVAAAEVDEDRTHWKPRHIKAERAITPSADSLTRGHVAALHAAGTTRAEMLDYARHAGLNEMQVEILDADLDSYGTWD